MRFLLQCSIREMVEGYRLFERGWRGIGVLSEFSEVCHSPAEENRWTLLLTCLTDSPFKRLCAGVQGNDKNTIQD